ncbi:hypothetical protein Q3G72_013993 [Acer saccharum]|nr:hypothetical protein Q3G72_013993 [Acer saccharum]
MKLEHIKHKKWDYDSVIEDKQTGEQDHELEKEKEMNSDQELEKEINSNHELEKKMNLDLKTGGVVASLKGPNEIKRFDSVGRLSEFMEAKIVDPITAEPLLPGQKGELWLRGPAIMKGYVGDDKATAEILDSEGWLKTGDLCYFDSQAFLFIVDRLKELIKYKAYQVPPAELEHLLQTNPEIIDAAVIPYPDEETGQVPMAFVVRKPGSQITEVQVPPYKRIRRVAFVNSIPKSSAGKILRKQLVDHALSATLFN